MHTFTRTITPPKSYSPIKTTAGFLLALLLTVFSISSALADRDDHEWGERGEHHGWHGGGYNGWRGGGGYGYGRYGYGYPQPYGYVQPYGYAQPLYAPPPVYYPPQPSPGINLIFPLNFR